MVLYRYCGSFFRPAGRKNDPQGIEHDRHRVMSSANPMVTHTTWPCSHIFEITISLQMCHNGKHGQLNHGRIRSGRQRSRQAQNRRREQGSLLTRSTYVPSITCAASLITSRARGRPRSTAGRDSRHPLAAGPRNDSRRISATGPAAPIRVWHGSHSYAATDGGWVPHVSARHRAPCLRLHPPYRSGSAHPPGSASDFGRLGRRLSDRGGDICCTRRHGARTAAAIGMGSRSPAALRILLSSLAGAHARQRSVGRWVGVAAPRGGIAISGLGRGGFRMCRARRQASRLKATHRYESLHTAESARASLGSETS
jgi:hypothetical protein